MLEFAVERGFAESLNEGDWLWNNDNGKLEDDWDKVDL